MLDDDGKFHIPSSGDVFQYPSLHGDLEMTVVGDVAVYVNGRIGKHVYFYTAKPPFRWINHADEDQYFVWLIRKSVQGDGLW